MIYIDEGNLYKTTLQSRKPEAELFQDWLCYDVAPTIRKYGAYMIPSTMDQMISDPDFGIKLLNNLKEERRQKELYRQRAELQSKVIEEAAPKVEYYNEVLQSESDFTTTTIAKELGISARALNKILVKRKIIYYIDGHYVLYSKYKGKGYTKTRTATFEDSQGNKRTQISTTWTELGRKFIHSFIKQNVAV